MQFQQQTIKEKIQEAMKGKENRIFRRGEIIDAVLEKHGHTNRSSVMPSDHCYNLINNGIKFELPRLFKYLKRNSYQYLGPVAFFEGNITHNGKVVGHWKNGLPVFFNKDFPRH